MAQTPKTPQQSGQQPPLTRRASSRRQREQRRQRLVLTIVGAALGLALLAVLIGVSYDQLWIPSRPVAQVGSATLTRRAYWAERRNEIARRITQNIQLQALFGNQFGDQFEQQIVVLDGELANIRSAPIDDDTVTGWIEHQLIVQNAASQYQVQASDGEVAQQLLGDLGRVFSPPPPPPTSTTSLTPTAVIVPTSAPTNTPGGPTETPAATATQAPTETPSPTALPEVALSQEDAIVGQLFDAYQQQILRLSPDPAQPLKANLTIDDFKAALRDQYLRQAITAKVQEQLVPATGFAASTEPTGLDVRQILITTTATLSDTQEVRDAAFAARRPDAEALLATLRAGADFAETARQSSEDFATRDDGGTLPTFDLQGKTTDGRQMDPAIVQATLALQENGISDLIQTPFGWHIIQLVRRNVPSTETQLQEARTKKFDEWVTQQRTATSIERFPTVAPTPTTAPTPTQGILPTVQLYATPTATSVPTTTTSLDSTPTATP